MSISRRADADEPLQRVGHGGALPGEREDAPVVGGVAGAVEEVRAGHGFERRGEAVDHLEPAALGHVRDGLDERHAGIVAHRRLPARRDRAARPPAPRRLSAARCLARAARPSLWRSPDFLRLWTAETVSQLGTQVSALAIPFVAIDLLEASTFEVALLGVVDFLPFLLIGLPAGVWVDRLRRRPVMIAGTSGGRSPLRRSRWPSRSGP